MKKNLGCKTCGYYSYNNHACAHDKNIKSADYGDFFGNVVADWHIHEKWNKRNRCKKYKYGYNQTTPKGVNGK